MSHKRGRGVKYYFELQTKLRALIDDMNYRVSLVIVEGMRDEAALRDFGLKSPVEKLCESRLQNFAFEDAIVRDYSGSTVLVLLDFDEEGLKMTQRLEVNLEERGVKVDHFLRRSFGELIIRNGIRRIEEIKAIKNKASLE